MRRRSPRNRAPLSGPPLADRFKLPRLRGGLRQEWRTIRLLMGYLWPAGEPGLKARVVVAMGFLAGAKLINVCVPIFYKEVVDAISRPDRAMLVVPIGLVVAYGLARMAAQAFGELREAVFAKVGQRAIRTIALLIFRHLHSLSLRFHLERQTGGMSRAIERGTTGIDYLLSFMLFNVIPTLFELLLVCGILWRFYSADLALTTLVTIVVYVSYTVGVTDWRVKFRREMNSRDAEANTKAIDSLLNFETVKYFANEEHEAHRFEGARRRYERAAVLSETTLSLLNVGQGAIIAVGLIAVMILAGRGVTAGRLTVGDFVLVNTYLIQLYLPLNMLGMVYRNIKQSLTDLEAMFGLLDVEPEVQDRPHAPALIVRGGAVEFDAVQFGYDPRRPILQDVSFSVPAGRTLAIVGPSGAGKSTIGRLLFRFYDVDGGAVRIDGQDVRDVTQLSLRQAIGVVPQDTVLFNDTIYYNIAYGRPDATRAEVAEAARLARIADLLDSLPDGFDTQVGERGLKLSGGEKQRVAIARVILKRPELLIFDEATSALDTRTEQAIQTSLNEVSANRTTVVVAHRLSTIVDADQIIVLADGRIAERGTHPALLRQDGLYAAMWARQRAAAEREAALAG